MLADRPLITALIPTYCRPQLLERAICSVLNQTYPYLRVHVYDNASGDETASVVAALAREDPRIEYYCHPRNIGMNANFSYAMERVETPYFSVLSDDDYYYPTFYETAMEGFTRHPDAMFSAAASVVVHDNETVQIATTKEGYFSPPDGFLAFTQPGGPGITSMVLRREVIDQVGRFEETIFHADIEYCWRIASRFPFVTSARPGLIFNMHRQQGTRQAAIDTHVQSYLMLLERVQVTPNVPAEVQREVERFLRKCFSQAILHVGLVAIREGNVRRSRHAAEMLRRHFGQQGRAAVLELLARTYGYLPPLRCPIRRLSAGAIVIGTAIYRLAGRDWSQAALNREVKEFVNDVAASSNSNVRRDIRHAS